VEQSLFARKTHMPAAVMAHVTTYLTLADIMVLRKRTCRRIDMDRTEVQRATEQQMRHLQLPSVSWSKLNRLDKQVVPTRRITHITMSSSAPGPPPAWSVTCWARFITHFPQLTSITFSKGAVDTPSVAQAKALMQNGLLHLSLGGGFRKDIFSQTAIMTSVMCAFRGLHTLRMAKHCDWAFHTTDFLTELGPHLQWLEMAVTSTWNDWAHFVLQCPHLHSVCIRRRAPGGVRAAAETVAALTHWKAQRRLSWAWDWEPDTAETSHALWRLFAGWTELTRFDWVPTRVGVGDADRLHDKADVLHAIGAWENIQLVDYVCPTLSTAEVVRVIKSTRLEFFVNHASAPVSSPLSVSELVAFVNQHPVFGGFEVDMDSPRRFTFADCISNWTELQQTPELHALMMSGKCREWDSLCGRSPRLEWLPHLPKLSHLHVALPQLDTTLSTRLFALPWRPLEHLHLMAGRESLDETFLPNLARCCPELQSFRVVLRRESKSPAQSKLTLDGFCQLLLGTTVKAIEFPFLLNNVTTLQLVSWFALCKSLDSFSFVFWQTDEDDPGFRRIVRENKFFLLPSAHLYHVWWLNSFRPDLDIP
jgi:hypothetical protein